MKKLLLGLLIFGSTFTATYTYLDVTGGQQDDVQLSTEVSRETTPSQPTNETITTRETTNSIDNDSQPSQNIATIAGQQLILPEGTTISCGDIEQTQIGYRSDTAVLKTTSGTWRGELTIHGDGWVFTQYNKIIEQGVVL